MNILVIGDTHIPFEKKNYLDFCIETKKKYKCSLTVHIGDLVDFHAISSHDHNPDGFSPKQELDEAKRKIKDWVKAFPKASLCIGNHDERLNRAAIKYGLSVDYFRDYKQLFGLPKAWDYQLDYYIHKVRFFHGMGYGGKYAHIAAATEQDCSVVMGHLHSNFGVEYVANEGEIKFGLAVSCGINRHSYAFNYGRDFRRKPMMGCGVVLENGKIGLPVPMKL